MRNALAQIGTFCLRSSGEPRGGVYRARQSVVSTDYNAPKVPSSCKFEYFPPSPTDTTHIPDFQSYFARLLEAPVLMFLDHSGVAPFRGWFPLTYFSWQSRLLKLIRWALSQKLPKLLPGSIIPDFPSMPRTISFPE